MPEVISVVIADDHPVVRQGLRQALERDSHLKVLADAADGESALALLAELKPRVAVLDIDMPKADGFAVMREVALRRLPVEVIFLTMHSGPDLFYSAMDLGVKGYVLKDCALVEIVQAIHAVALGRHYVTSTLTGLLVHRREQIAEFERSHSGLQSLTGTERKILRSIADEKSSKEIAAELFLHHRTVENYRTLMCQKLGIHGPSALLKFALQNKIKL